MANKKPKLAPDDVEALADEADATKTQVKNAWKRAYNTVMDEEGDNFDLDDPRDQAQFYGLVMYMTRMELGLQENRYRGNNMARRRPRRRRRFFRESYPPTPTGVYNMFMQSTDRRALAAELANVRAQVGHTELTVLIHETLDRIERDKRG